MAQRSEVPALPGEDDAEAARVALVRVRDALAAHGDSGEAVGVRVEDEADPVTIPRPAMDLLVRVLAAMSAGQAVNVMPAHAELTTRQAADLLNVSRPFLIGLLESGEIRYRKVGTHRRVQVESLLDYQRRYSAERLDAADELSKLSQEMGML